MSDPHSRRMREFEMARTRRLAEVSTAYSSPFLLTADIFGRGQSRHISSLSLDYLGQMKVYTMLISWPAICYIAVGSSLTRTVHSF